VLEVILRILLRWYKRQLEREINFNKWMPELSAKLDAIHVLLED
jgi:hypothetical protein